MSEIVPPPSSSDWLRTIGRGVALLLLVGSVLVIAGLALRASPEIRTLKLMPDTVGRFFDRHDFLKNVIGFGLLQGVLGMVWPLTGFSSGGRRGLGLAAAVAAGVAILECVQLFLPRRVADWGDVLAGWLGVLAAVLVLEGVRGVGAWCRAVRQKRLAAQALAQAAQAAELPPPEVVP